MRQPEAPAVSRGRLQQQSLTFYADYQILIAEDTTRQNSQIDLGNL
jgi:hypothetical protein